MNNKTRTIVYGVLLGAATGFVAAMMLNRQADQHDGSTAITTGEGVKLGAMIFGILRTIAAFGDNDKK